MIYLHWKKNKRGESLQKGGKKGKADRCLIRLKYTPPFFDKWRKTRRILEGGGGKKGLGEPHFCNLITEHDSA